jgi:hypothetical protein
MARRRERHADLVITVITGPPCSGKSTYARERAKPGDVTVDFDAMAQAFGSPVSHGHDQAIAKVTVQAWEAAIRAAIAAYRQRQAMAWIIHSRPGQAWQQEYRACGAVLVPLSASREELHRRADADSRPADWHRRIDEFLTGAGRGDPVPLRRTRW